MQFCGSRYLQTHATAMGTKMAVAFVNIFIARIENQILRQSCIKPYSCHQRIFLAAAGCSGVGSRPTGLWPKAEVTRGEATRKNARKKAFRDFTEPETAYKKPLGTQGN